jgi:hypothetical protein
VRRKFRRTLPRARSTFTPRDALAAAAAFAVALALAPVQRVQRLLDHPREVRVTASSFASDLARPENAFDNVPFTSWVAQGSGPATLDLTPDRPGLLRGVTLRPRRTVLMEAWHTVRVVGFDGGAVVVDREQTFPGAARDEYQYVALGPVRVDRIQLTFRDPIVELPNGTRVDPGAVNPGYGDITLDWER